MNSLSHSEQHCVNIKQRKADKKIYWGQIPGLIHKLVRDKTDN